MATKNFFNYDREIRSRDDYRLPGSLMSVEEFLEAVRLMDSAGKDAGGSEDMSEGGSRYLELYSLLQRCHDKFQTDPDKAGRCVICGEKIKIDKDGGTKNIICGKCQNRLYKNEFPSTQNTRGLRNWGRFCSVCHNNPVHPCHNGLCQNCYKLVDNNQRIYLWKNRAELLPEELLTMDQKDPEVVRMEKKYLNDNKWRLLPDELNGNPSDPEVIRRFRINGFAQQVILGEKAASIDLRKLIGSGNNDDK